MRRKVLWLFGGLGVATLGGFHVLAWVAFAVLTWRRLRR